MKRVEEPTIIFSTESSWPIGQCRTPGNFFSPKRPALAGSDNANTPAIPASVAMPGPIHSNTEGGTRSRRQLRAVYATTCDRHIMVHSLKTRLYRSAHTWWVGGKRRCRAWRTGAQRVTLSGRAPKAIRSHQIIDSQPKSIQIRSDHIRSDHVMSNRITSSNHIRSYHIISHDVQSDHIRKTDNLDHVLLGVPKVPLTSLVRASHPPSPAYVS